MGIRVPGLMFPVLSVIVFVTLSYTAEPPDTLADGDIIWDK